MEKNLNRSTDNHTQCPSNLYPPPPKTHQIGEYQQTPIRHFVVLSILYLFVRPIECYLPVLSLNGVSTAVGTGIGSEMPGYPLNLYYHSMDTPSDEFFVGCVYNDQTPFPTPSLIMYASNGTRKGGFNTALWCYSIIIKDNLKMFVSEEDNLITKVITLQADVNKDYSLSMQSSITSADANANRAIDDPNTNYVVVADTFMIRRLDIVGPIGEFSRVYFVTNGFYSSSIFKLQNQSVYLICNYNTYLYYMSQSTLGHVLLKSFSIANAANAFWSTLNNFNEETLYTYDTNPDFTAFNISGLSAASILHRASFAVYGTQSKMINLESYNYLMTFPSSQQSKILFINKLTFAVENVTDFLFSDPSYVTVEGSICQFVKVDDRLYFGIFIQNPSAINFQYYYLRIDNCTTRTVDTCDLCPANTYMTNKTAFNRCLHPSFFPALTGINLADNPQTISPCSSLGCLDCTFDHSKCTLCDTAANFNLSNDVCVPKDGFGYNTGVSPNTVIACNVQYCGNCSSNYLLCGDCASNMIFNTISGFCEPLDGFGFNSPTQPADPCTVTACTKCAANFQTCTMCATGATLSSNQCPPDPGFGFAPAPSLVLPCQGPDCVQCTANYVVCEVCDPLADDVLDAGVCIPRELYVVHLQETKVSDTDNSVYVLFDANIDLQHFDIELLDFYMYFAANDSSSQPLEKGKDIGVETLSNGLKILILTKKEIKDGRMIINLSSGATIDNLRSSLNSSKIFNQFPIEIKGLNLNRVVEQKSKDNKSDFFSGLNVSVRVLMILNLVVSFLIQNQSSSRFIKLFSEFAPIGLLNLPKLEITTRILKTILETNLIPFNTFIYEALFNPSECDIPAEFQDKVTQCGFLENQGEDILVIFVIGFIAASLAIIEYFKQKTALRDKAKVKPKNNPTQPEQSKWARIFCFVTSRIQYSFINLLESVQAECACYILIHMRFVRGWSASSIFGYALGVATILYYVMAEIMRIRVSRRIVKDMKDKNKKPLPVSENGKKLLLSSMVSLKNYKYSIFAKNLDDSKIPLHAITIFLPSMISLMNLLIGFLVITCYRFPILQLSLVTLLTSAYLTCRVITNSSGKPQDNYIEYLEKGIKICFLLLMLLSRFVPASYSKVIDLLSSLFVLSMIVINALYVLFNLFADLIYCMKSKRNDVKSEDNLVLKIDKIVKKPNTNTNQKVIEPRSVKFTPLRNNALSTRSIPRVVSSQTLRSRMLMQSKSRENLQNIITNKPNKDSK